MLFYGVVVLICYCGQRGGAQAENEELDRYCSAFYTWHQLPVDKKNGFCQCFTEQLKKVDPVVRKAIIYIGEDPEYGATTRDKVNALTKELSEQEKLNVIQQMEDFPKAAGPICAKTLE